MQGYDMATDLSYPDYSPQTPDFFSDQAIEFFTPPDRFEFQSADYAGPPDIEKVSVIREWILQWHENSTAIPDMHSNLENFILRTVANGSASIYDFVVALGMRVWGDMPDVEFRHLRWELQRLEEDNTQSANTARKLMAETTGVQSLGRAKMVELDSSMPTYWQTDHEPPREIPELRKILEQYVIGATPRMVLASIRRMVTAFQSDYSRSSIDLVACLYPVFEQAPVNRIMCAINDGVDEYMTLDDMLSLVGTCRDIDHLRVFRKMSTVKIRFATQNAKDASALEGKLMRYTIPRHIFTAKQARSDTVMENLPILHLPMPRIKVDIKGSHAATHPALMPALIGNSCRDLRITDISVARVTKFLLESMCSKGEPNERTRTVRSLTIGLNARDLKEPKNAKKDLLQMVFHMFPGLTTLDISSPHIAVMDPDLDKAMYETASTSPPYDYLIYKSLKSLRFDMAEANCDPFMGLLTGFRQLEKCIIGKTATLWMERRNIICRNIVETSANLKYMEVGAPITCKLPHIASIVLWIESTTDVLPIIDPATHLTVEAHHGRRSDLANLMSNHQRLCVNIYKCTDIVPFDYGHVAKRRRGVGMFQYRYHPNTNHHIC